MTNSIPTNNLGSETPQWEQKPSHCVNLPKHLFITFCAFLWLLIPRSAYANTHVLLLIYSILVLTFNLPLFLKMQLTRYKITTQRLFIYSGVLNRKREEIELYRVKDYRVVSPLYLRIFKLSNITIITSDKITPTITLLGVKDAYEIANLIRHLVEEMRDKKGVREID